MLPSGSLAEAVKFTLNGVFPFVTLALAVTVGGCPVTVLLRNHGVVVASVLKSVRSCSPTLGTPPVGDGCVKSGCKSLHSQVNPSERATVPSAQRYGPQQRRGATTAPRVTSQLRFPRPAIWSSINHFVENPPSKANGSGFNDVATLV